MKKNADGMMKNYSNKHMHSNMVWRQRKREYNSCSGRKNTDTFDSVLNDSHKFVEHLENAVFK